MFLFISYYFFSLNFGLRNFYWPFFKFTHLSGVTITDALMKDILHFCYCVLLLEVPLDSFIVSIPLLTLHMCTFIVSMHFIRIHNILIIVILNSLINPTSASHLSLALKTAFFSWLLARFVFICWKPGVIFQVIGSEVNRLLTSWLVLIWLGAGMYLMFSVGTIGLTFFQCPHFCLLSWTKASLNSLLQTEWCPTSLYLCL